MSDFRADGWCRRPEHDLRETSEIVEILDAGSVFAHPRCTNVRSLRARCAKPPFCDADGDEADSDDDEGDARRTVLDNQKKLTEN